MFELLLKCSVNIWKHFDYNLLLFHLQLPIAVLSPGRRPITRSEKDTLIQSAYEFFLFDEDMTQIDKQCVPVVLGYNSEKMHYVPNNDH